MRSLERGRPTSRPAPVAHAGAHPLKLVLHSLCRYVNKEQLQPDELCALLCNPDMVAADVAAAVATQLADVFWFIGLELEAEEPKREAAKKALAGPVAAANATRWCLLTCSRHGSRAICCRRPG